MMGNPKVICISAVVGFVLSFLIGLISGVGFGTIVLRALIFAVVFAALSFGISFLYNSFLSDTSKVGSSADVEAPSQKSVTGGVVNIVVDDSNLADEDSAPKFSVSSGRTSLGAQELSQEAPVPAASRPAVSAAPVEKNPEPVQKAAEPVAESAAPVSAQTETQIQQTADSPVGFVPAGLNTITKSDSNAEKPAENAASEVSAAQQGSTEDALDVLPEIGNVNLAEATANPVISDSDFASSSSSSSSGAGSGQDTNVMAQAIRTLLAKD